MFFADQYGTEKKIRISGELLVGKPAKANQSEKEWTVVRSFFKEIEGK